jgi:hypothetical protein
MRRILRPLVVSAVAALAIELSGLSEPQAQTVMPPSAPANCVQNAGNGELACGSGATANPGTGATAIGIRAPRKIGLARVAQIRFQYSPMID